MSRRLARHKRLRGSFSQLSTTALVLVVVLAAVQGCGAFRLSHLRPLLAKQGTNSTTLKSNKASDLRRNSTAEHHTPPKDRLPALAGDVVVHRDNTTSTNKKPAHEESKIVHAAQNHTSKAARQDNDLSERPVRAERHSHRRSHSEVHDKTAPAEKPKPPRSGALDIVLTHYDPARLQQMVDYWVDFLQLEMVQDLKPYVYVYCQNQDANVGHEAEIKPLLQHGGEVIHLENVGRESHAFLQHITMHYDDLANHTIFAQDISSQDLPARFQGLFMNTTGFLPLSLVGHVDCADTWLPAGAIPQIYAMFASQLCPPEGYTAGFEGQFVVSKKRILKHGMWTYRHLLELLRADESHWIHSMHNIDHYKDKTNPMFGHVMERAWSVAFDCFESWRMNNCYMCIWNGMQDCGWDACQCFDRQ